MPLFLYCRPTALVVALALTLAAQISATPPAAQPARPASQSLVSENEDSQLYRNTAFGFRYRIPYGWVDRTREMQEGKEAGKGQVLLAIFERPPEATGDTINSAVVIASESVASYPGLKKAEDYVSPLTELATAKGFQPAGDAYPVEEDSRQFLRADFTKALAGKLAMHQSTLILLTKGQIVSFTFIAGSEDELDHLMDGLHFGLAKSVAR